MKKQLFCAAVAVLGLVAGPLHAQSLDALIAAAQKEGEVDSVGMPDSWANWKDTWKQLGQKYGLRHQDTDMSSAQELAKFAAEKGNATADIGDVGHPFGPIAAQMGIAQPYKPSTWDQIPAWAKDPNGNWVVAYTGTIAFIVDKRLVKDVPHAWSDLLKGKYKVTVGNVGVASQANYGVLAAAYAMGGNEANLGPALAFFAKLARQNRLLLNEPNVANIEKGEVEVGVVWDFNGLNYRDKIDRNRFTVVIPADGSVTAGYTTIINRYARHPNAAKLAREYILSDAGQINLARGYARPIRAAVKLPPDVQAKLIPAAQYKSARPIANFAAWENSTRRLPRDWQERVMIDMR